MHNSLSFSITAPVSFPIRYGIRGTPRPYNSTPIPKVLSKPLNSKLLKP